MKKFRTLRGFLGGDEPDEEVVSNYSATLRIWGAIPDLDSITRALILQPTHTWRKGEAAHAKATPSDRDMWSYTVPIPETEPLEKHIDALWTRIRDHSEYLLELKKTLNVDVFLGYRSNCDFAGVEIPFKSLEMFTVLQIPLGISIAIA